MRRVLTAWIMALAAFALPAKAENEHAVLALPADVMQFLGIYAAQDLGFWKSEGLDVKIVFIAGVGSFNAVVSSSADFSVSSAASLTRAAAHGQRMLGIANMIDKPVWGIVIAKPLAEAAHFDPQAPLAARAKILAGKRISIDVVNSVIHAYLRAVAKAGGVDPDGIEATPMQPPEAIAAFARHAIDGFVSGPPWVEMVEADGSATLVASPLNGDPGWIAPNGSGVIVTRPALCAEHRSLCAKMGRGLAAGARFIHEEPQQALALMKQHFDKASDAVLARALTAIAAGTPSPPALTAAILANSERLNVEAGFLAPANQLKSYDGLFTDEFVRPN
jgi:NitT/TauT family transport system substrate-binding protein